jgi:hypothetical protein
MDKMKRFSLILVMAFFMFSMDAIASNADLFEYDQNEVGAAVADLNELEAMVAQNEQITYTELIEAGNPVALSLSTDTGKMAEGVSMPILPAFWWGCLLGPVGLVIVYFVEQDPAQTRSAFWGCFWSFLIYGGGSAFYWFNL